MSCLPIIPEEIASFEQRLGVTLPESYKAFMQDSKILQVLFSKGIGMLRLGDTMQQYAEMTEAIRKQQPKFPQNGVLMSVAVTRNGTLDHSLGYPRFFLPDKKSPGRLSDVVYSWDASRGKKTRDCTVAQWVASFIECADDQLLSELGLVKSNIWETKRPKIKNCNDKLMGLLSLRGKEVIEATKEIKGKWLLCTDMNFRGKYLNPRDLGQLPEEPSGILLPIQPGKFKAEVLLEQSSLGEWLIIEKMRVISDSPKDELSQPAGEMSVDHAALALFDQEEFLRKVSEDDYDSVVMDLLGLEIRPCVLLLGRLPILVIPTGDGDGNYPVIQLYNDNGPVGMEVRFKRESKT